MVQVPRYFLLVGDSYYPNGWSDYVAQSDDADELEKMATGVRLVEGNDKWYEVVDVIGMKVVRKSGIFP